MREYGHQKGSPSPEDPPLSATAARMDSSCPHVILPFTCSGRCKENKQLMAKSLCGRSHGGGSHIKGVTCDKTPPNTRTPLLQLLYRTCTRRFYLTFSHPVFAIFARASLRLLIVMRYKIPGVIVLFHGDFFFPSSNHKDFH